MKKFSAMNFNTIPIIEHLILNVMIILIKYLSLFNKNTPSPNSNALIFLIFDYLWILKLFFGHTNNLVEINSELLIEQLVGNKWKTIIFLNKFDARMIKGLY